MRKKTKFGKMLLTKRRSRSENRKVEPKENAIKDDVDHRNFITRNDRSRRSQTQEKRTERLERTETVPRMGRRKTSAELISEAKIFLGSMNASNRNLVSNITAPVGGVRLLNTRRPITPREPGRALYGKVSLAGRPPSSFSLRYLQNEGPRTPKISSLEPIKVQSSMDLDTISDERLNMQFKMKRSNSFDVGQPENNQMNGSTENSEGGSTLQKAFTKRLPALEVKGVALGAKMEANPTIGDFNIIRKDFNDHTLSTDSTESIKAISLLTSRKFLTTNCNILAQSSTEKLIELLKEHAGLKDCTEETVHHISSILNELYGRVRKSEKSFKRGFILGGLYGLVECTSPQILLAVARVVLALHVTGSNLTGACKLIFKVARNEQNDKYFQDNELLELLIDGLGRASPLDDPEACIYGYGSIRFLMSSNGQERTTEVQSTKNSNRNWVECLQVPRKPATAPAGELNKKLPTERILKFNKQCTLVERLARHGAVELMVLHLQILNEAGATKKLSGPPLHSLFQLSAALRALADVSQISSTLEKDHFDGEAHCMGKKLLLSTVQLELACPHLIRAAEISIGELEVQGNIVRTLSILSEDENCCKVLTNFTARIGMLLGPYLELLSGSSEKLLSLFSRLGYILGNIMAKHDEARVQFYHNDVAMEYLLKVMQLYAKEPLNLHNSLGDTVIDVLIKMIRVVANMSVNSEVGFGLGNTYALGGLLLKLLNATHDVKAIQQQNDVQELTMATLGTLHNLCFYQDQNSMPAQVMESVDALQAQLLDVTTALCKILHNSHDPVIVVEAARVLGNITRNEKARIFFCKSGGLTLILQHMHQKHKNIDCLDYDLKVCTAGILVNLLGDAENREPFLHLDGFTLLMGLLKLALVKHHDWFLATIICQAFWNLLIDSPHMTDICDDQKLDEICDLLSDYLDEQLLDDANIDEPDTLWEGFAVVATDLLERIQNNFELESQEKLSQFVHGNQDNDDEADVYIEGM